MSGFNLEIDPKLLVSHGAIFLGNLWVIKKFYVTPYLKMLSLRESSTVGADEQTRGLLQKSTELAKKIQDRLTLAEQKALDRSKEIKEKALVEQTKIFEAVRAKTLLAQEETLLSINKMYEQELGNLPTLLKGLSSQIFSKICPPSIASGG